MKEIDVQHEVKWYDKRLLMCSTVFGLICFAIFLYLAKRAEPPEGFVFPRAPTISGIYKCCEAGGRYSQSWVGDQGINCRGFSFFHLGTGRNDCGLKNQLNGAKVTAERVLVPAYDGPLPLVSRIHIKGDALYEVSDDRILYLWRRGSLNDAILLGYVLALIFHAAQMIWSNRKVQKHQGSKK